MTITPIKKINMIIHFKNLIFYVKTIFLSFVSVFVCFFFFKKQVSTTVYKITINIKDLKTYITRP